ncbi:MAG: MBL fold metallo-hydrolase [Candidatus Heimdallarchaeota archaeon]|nr:MBL fold metallo-hydrolase [Candidatus Heimdallarchaeota archaeon]MCK4953996.1 MBL fold metallo-hydrolase [Candidatus Heimdallarchaeota archaeon]
MPTLLKYDKGIKLFKKPENLLFIADPTSLSATRGCNAVFISHAHTDHSIAFPNEDIKVYSTQIASELYEKLTSRKTKNTHFVNFNKKIKVDNVEIKFIPAGHLLGAAQIIFYFDDMTLCYTGDICTDEMITVPKASVPDEDIDVLIIEATYGKQDLFFDSRDRIKGSILEWITGNLQEKHLSIINIAHLGAAQEIIAYLNNMLSIDIYCDARTSEINKIYNNKGTNLHWNRFDLLNDDKLENENSVVFLPRAAKELPSFLENLKVSRSIVTGQASRFAFSNFEQAFPFSMHSNCQELLEYVKTTKAKRVYTLYGFDSELAAIIRQKFKIFARPMKYAKKKLTLEEFL